MQSLPGNGRIVNSVEASGQSSQVVATGEKSSNLLWQRFLCGAAAGLVLTLLIEFLPLNTAEMGMLELQYKLAKGSPIGQNAIKVSKDISLVVLDDNSQYDFEITKFADRRSQHVLTELIKELEAYDPAVIVIDLDLRGACDQELASLMQTKKNIALAIFGNTDQDNELPATDPWPCGAYLEHTVHGRTQLKHEVNGAVYELPIYEHERVAERGNQNQRLLAAEPSLVEAVLGLNKDRTGVGPDVKALRRGWMPLYLSPREVKFPQIVFQKALLFDDHDINNQDIRFVLGDNPKALFGRKIVMIGTVLTQLTESDATRRASREEHPSHLSYQARALETLLNGGEISSFPRKVEDFIAIFLATLFGGFCAIANWRARTLAYIFGCTVVIGVGIASFQALHVSVSVVAPWAILSGCYIVSSFIFMDADLRIRNRELALARRSMQVRAEEERQRIAEDLHDETLPNLSVVARMADQLSKSLKDNPVPTMMRERLDFSIAEMRRVINDLHPSVLETMGLKLALENLLEQVGKDGNFKTSFSDNNGFDETQLSKETQLLLYRIVQEALNNVRKHSHANRVEVHLHSRNGSFVIAVRDDGVGIGAKAARGDSHGIVNIRQRAQLIGARVDWHRPRAFDSGTELQIELPLPRAEKENG